MDILKNGIRRFILLRLKIAMCFCVFVCSICVAIGGIPANKPIEVRDHNPSASRAKSAANTENATDLTSFGGNFAAGDYLTFKGIDFGVGGYKKFMLTLSANAANAGKKIEVRLDSPKGVKIGEIILTDTKANRLQLYTYPHPSADGQGLPKDNPPVAPSHPYYENHPTLPLFKEHYADIIGGVLGVRDVYLYFPSATNVDMDYILFSTYTFTPYAGDDPVGQGQSYKYLAIKETPEEKSVRMKWWRDADYGMFIHFGPYAYLGGSPLEPDGRKSSQQNSSGSEWIMKRSPENGLRNAVTRENYRENVSAKFNPENWNAKEVVKLAQDAGQKYVVITARHHDGFSMYDTKIREFRKYSITTVANGGKFRRDLVRELADACQTTYGTDKEVKFGAYLTLVDWYDLTQFPIYGRNISSRSTMSDSPEINDNFNGVTQNNKDLNKADYISRLKGQIKEMIVDYGAQVLWFDCGGMFKFSREESYDVYHFARTLNPDIIISNRIFTDRIDGSRVAKDLDFYTFEQSSIGTKLNNDAELCLTLNNSWGYNAVDKNWKSPQLVIQRLLECIGSGGNLLLNIGPDDNGDVPIGSKEILREAGKWLEKYGNAYYNTRPGFYETEELPSRVYTTAKEGKLFIHLTPNYTEPSLTLDAPENAITGVRALNDETPVNYRLENGKIFFNLTGITRDPYVTILEVSVEGDIPKRKKDR